MAYGRKPHLWEAGGADCANQLARCSLNIRTPTPIVPDITLIESGTARPAGLGRALEPLRLLDTVPDFCPQTSLQVRALFRAPHFMYIVVVAITAAMPQHTASSSQLMSSYRKHSKHNVFGKHVQPVTGKQWTSDKGPHPSDVNFYIKQVCKHCSLFLPHSLFGQVCQELTVCRAAGWRRRCA